MLMLLELTQKYFGVNSWCLQPYCTVHWVKNNRMFHFSATWIFFYLQRREWIFFWHTTWYINVEYLSHVWCCMNIYIRNNPLTWSGGSLYLAATLSPCWPHAWSELPQFWSPCPIPVALIFPFLPTWWILWTQTTLTHPSLLPSGTIKVATFST